MATPSADDALPDGFDWLSLDPEEEVVWTGNPHSMSLVPAFVVGIPLSLVLVGLFVIASAYLSRENTEYVITTEALYKKRGVLSRDVKRVGFEKVQDTSYTQDFFGTQFGYGTVEISTAGGSGVELSFDNVEEPKRIQELVNERIRARDGRGSREESKGDVLDEILAELRAIRAAVEADPPTVTAGARDAGATAGDDDGPTESPPTEPSPTGDAEPTADDDASADDR
ncbi:PH domain-containing protein [Halobaculum sp. CBA1158]|uniref:PH domain-containing protein n=1 Tax=Halobaculum sp. CBA1158 TaxID=2904243 RepID=UPI001F1F6FB6|nr:PH domain-containing protein [Halobaculum sp. CBA1158]UIO99208.1 PH domain-containing protein [Halobaculum sp. CBA1158]